ncbi:PREDICTED: GDSL esterase/lipase At2g24560 [Tarenaya hassleriana]|uniref:GDSL esterase/lipase At2g24560 n=1 Tax=Tarenaya hassleriana TaxID=28532 RepID=UPI00053C142A|nr:PREDICTED: GDSL esterase/lipase At2g24560 [Tarenaya hassleriana]
MVNSSERYRFGSVKMSTTINVMVGLFLVTWLSSSCNAARTNVTSSTYRPFPAILIFGDSTVDTGNNNYFSAVFRASHLPYGMDSPGYAASGRFSNGKLFSDILAERFNIKRMVPPYLKPFLTPQELVSGVCFASSGAGYDERTSLITRAIPVSNQIYMFKRYIAKVKGIVGEAKAAEIISNALVLVSAGPNDFIFNYYQTARASRRLQFSNISGYQDLILNKLQGIVRELYNLGCRKIVVGGLPVMGCLPVQMTMEITKLTNRTCVEDQNRDSVSYNQKLQNLLPKLEASLPGSGILYSDVYKPMMDMLQHPSKYGFKETKKGCCGTGLLETTFLCNVFSRTCPNHSEYMFWDSIHPTEAVANYYGQFIEPRIRRKFLSAKGR